MKHVFISPIFMLAFLLCHSVYAADVEDFAVNDVHTYSNFNYVSVKKMDLNLDLLMEQKIFSGYVDLHIENIAGQNRLILDTDALNIKSAAISASTMDVDAKSINFLLGQKEKVRGQGLIIPIEPDTKIVRIEYETTDKSRGLDWIPAEQTADKKSPMIATQFQAINARTFVPCQDTPAQKITYEATIRLKAAFKDDNMRVLMSAVERTKIDAETFQFKMPMPIPTYLIALSAGYFAEEKISHRVSVFAEPSLVKKAADEFVDAEKMVQAAERLFGDYQWGRFDIFIMPPSFSFGGMENPTITFIGPTVVAGDKSLVDVIAHELAHSWSGNWVTNATWDDFWINEGTTMYIEREIVADLYGEDARDLDIVLGQEILINNIAAITKDETQGAPYTRLKLTMPSDFDPDDAVSFVPYEKGYSFWLALRQAYSRDAVNGFLKYYFDKFGRGTMTTAKLKNEVLNYAAFEGAQKIDIEDWLHGEGVPKAGLPKVESAQIDHVIKSVGQLKSHEGINSLGHEESKFNTKQWSYFLKRAHKIKHDDVKKLNDQFKLTAKNDEVQFEFYSVAIRSGAYKDYSNDVDKYLGRVGRVKYVGAIYDALKENNLREEAVRLFEKHKSHSSHITNGSIARKLGL